MIQPIALEIIVVCLGIFLLMVEAFSSKASKTPLAHLAILGLSIVFVLSFFVQPIGCALQESGFYVLDPLGFFFKRFALVATILTLVLALDYLPIIQRLVPGERPGAGSG